MGRDPHLSTLNSQHSLPTYSDEDTETHNYIYIDVKEKMTIQENLHTLESSTDDDTKGRAYNGLNNLFNAEARAGECPLMEEAVKGGYLKYLERDLATPNNACRRALSSLTHCSLQERIVAQVMPTDVIDRLIALVASRNGDEFADVALTCLSSMALFQVAHAGLTDAGVLRLALKNLHYLESADSDENGLDYGLTAASLLCRLVGKEESGPGPEAIRSNSLVRSPGSIQH